MIRQGLAEARDMLVDIASEPEAARLAERLTRLEERLLGWDVQEPSRMDRAATIDDVITLKMDVSRLCRARRSSGIISRGPLCAESSREALKGR